METRMGFDSFVNCIMSTKKDVEMHIREHHKINQDYISLVVRRKGANIGVVVSLGDLYGAYMSGQSMEKILETIDRLLSEAPVFDFSCLFDPEYVKPRLFIRVCNLERNKKFLESCPYEELEDLAITCHVMVGKNEGKSQSSIVNNEMMEMLGFTREELFAAAKKNAADILPVEVINMGDMMSQMFSIGFVSDEERECMEDIPMYIVTNQAKTNGASAIFYPGVMEKLADVLGEGFYILPSSVHETIILPEGSSSEMPLLEMVKEVNQKKVNPEDKLTDNVYYYDAQKKKLSVAR